MTYDRLQRILVWLLIASATIFLLDRLLMVVGALASPLLLFSIAWLFVLALKPLVDGLTRVDLPLPLLLLPNTTNHMHVTSIRVRLPHVAAVLLVYMGMITLIIGLVVLLVPIILPQLTNLQETMPQAATELLRFLDSVQRYIDRRGLNIDITTILRPEALSAQLGALGSEVVKQSFSLAGSIATWLFNLIFVLIVSFYMMLDGQRLLDRGLALLPTAWRGEVSTFLLIVDRTFGGFLRAQLLQSVLYGLATAAIMLVLGLPDSALASLIAGACVLIPIVGGGLAMIPPLVIAIISAPDRIIWLLVGLVVIQQVIFNVIMPRLLGQIVGLPPLLVFAALLIGGTLAGAWGILFGIPIAGVLASVFQFLYNRASFERATGITMPPVSTESEQVATNVSPTKP